MILSLSVYQTVNCGVFLVILESVILIHNSYKHKFIRALFYKGLSFLMLSAEVEDFRGTLIFFSLVTLGYQVFLPAHFGL